MAWKTIDLRTTRRRDIPKVSACYAYYGNGVALYVGATRNLKQRHNGRCWMRWVDFWMRHGKSFILKFNTKRKNCEIYEMRLIKRLKPQINGRTGASRTWTPWRCKCHGGRWKLDYRGQLMRVPI